MINKGLFTSLTDNWETPQYLFDELDREFHFTLDPCSNDENAKCKKHFTIEDNGLLQDWNNDIVFMNPPYGREIGKWVEKAYKSNTTVVCLLPARTDTKWFHDYIYNKSEIRFIKGRLKFGNSKNSAPFPSMIVIFRKDRVKEGNYDNN